MSRLFLSRSEKRGLLLLLLLLLCASGGLIYVKTAERTPPSLELSPDDVAALDAFETAIGMRERQTATPLAAVAELFPFNPNTADSLTLLRLGLRPRLIKHLLAYRRAGGRWKSADDFRRLYDLSAAEFARLRPYIQIPPTVRERYYTSADHIRQDSISRQYPQKFSQLTVLNLNEVDTLTLRKIPGVGPFYARAIVRHRERLGGFVSTAQLRDIEGLPERIEEWFQVEAGAPVRQIAINTSDFKTLVRHPYLSYEQVKVITTHIRKYGPLRSWSDLQLYDEFTSEDFHRLQPYFSFGELRTP